MSITVTATAEQIEVIGARFKFINGTQSDSFDKAGVFVALDRIGEDFHVLGVRPMPSVYRHPLGERWQEDWSDEAEGVVQFAWCSAPFDDEEFGAALAFHIATAIEDAYRRGERLRAERVA